MQRLKDLLKSYRVIVELLFLLSGQMGDGAAV